MSEDKDTVLFANVSVSVLTEYKDEYLHQIILDMEATHDTEPLPADVYEELLKISIQKYDTTAQGYNAIIGLIAVFLAFFTLLIAVLDSGSRQTTTVTWLLIIGVVLTLSLSASTTINLHHYSQRRNVALERLAGLIITEKSMSRRLKEKTTKCYAVKEDDFETLVGKMDVIVKHLEVLERESNRVSSLLKHGFCISMEKRQSRWKTRCTQSSQNRSVVKVQGAANPN